PLLPWLVDLASISPPLRRNVVPGDTVSLRCNISYHVEITWIKQPTDESPALLLTAHIGNDGKLFIKKQLSPRFTAQVSERSIMLTVGNVTAADCGLYYCLGKTEQNLLLGHGVALTGKEAQGAPNMILLVNKIITLFHNHVGEIS
uniref:Ig-like domain-containing protein n=1 Tax=Scleropages formosus TaxID=113540 RepID=A0A8C9RNA7_SCLFO